jgi:hypothetical protein
MKTRLFTFILLFLSVGVKAQPILTYPNNSLLNCDTYSYHEIQFADPGIAGRNQIWDYSKIQYTGKNPVSTLQAPALPKVNGISDYNISLLENSYDYWMNSTENGLEELGYVNPELKLVLRYTDPVLKMKYPFSYGNQLTDRFAGSALFNETSVIDLSGDVTVTADAFGRLILPDKIFESVLRVKSVKKGLQINMCGTTDFCITKYNWYAAGCRYPVMSISITENSTNGAAPVVTKAGFTNSQQISVNTKNAVLGAFGSQSNNSSNTIDQSDVKVVLSPNPFTENLTYNYSLTEPMNVSIELYDLLGKYSGWVINNQPQTVGLHRGELNASTYGLSPGVYFMRFTFDNQVVICKVVKM